MYKNHETTAWLFRLISIFFSFLAADFLSNYPSTPELIRLIFTSLLALLYSPTFSKSSFIGSYPIFTPMLSSISRNSSCSYCVTKLMASPSNPFLAVRPTLCTQSDTLRGIWQLITRFTLSISKPREVRSVVTRILACSVRNIPRLAMRWLNFMKEWRATAWQLRAFRVYAMRVHSLQVFTKMMILQFEFCSSILSRQPGLSSSGVNTNCWVRQAELTVLMPWQVECFTKSMLTPSIFCSFLPSKFSSMVAVASTICLNSLAEDRMIRISPSRLSQSNRSASSSTIISTLSISSRNLSHLESMSRMRPGVPTTTWGYASRSSICLAMLVLPMTRACLRFMPCPKMDSCWEICMASSMVGVMMSAKMLQGSRESLWMRGSPKAAVLPEPVSELAITLLPARIEGMARAWMGVGVLYWILSQVRWIIWLSPSLLKDMLAD